MQPLVTYGNSLYYSRLQPLATYGCSLHYVWLQDLKAGWPEWVTPKIRDAMHLCCDVNKAGHLAKTWTARAVDRKDERELQVW